MIHVQHGENKRLDMTRFNDAFMMHTSTSPQYGIIASCDVAAAMMEQPAGRALVQETIDEALSFRRAMSGREEAARRAPGGSTSGSRTRWPRARRTQRADWVLKPGDRWHGFEGLAENHVAGRPDQGHDPHARACLPNGTMQEHGIPAAVVTKFLSSRRIEIEKTGLYSFLVLFSMGITKGKWSTLVTELLNFKDLYDANAPLKRVLPALVEAHPDAYAKMGLKDLCEQIHQIYREDNVPKAQREMYTDAARDGDAAGRRLRAARARTGRERRDRRSHGPHAGGDGRAVSARHSR